MIRAALLLLLVAAPLAAQARVGDLVTRAGEVPVRLVGYGIVTGLDGTGDRSFGNRTGAVHTVQSVVNLLRRFNIEVPPEQMRLRNVAVVLVTAEVSPWLRPGGRFEIQVASIGDATSLRGGILWMTPLQTGPNEAPLATAQGSLPTAGSDQPTRGRYTMAQRSGTSARIAEGGILEVGLPAPVQVAGAAPILALRTPDLATASRIAEAINAAHGAGSAAVTDPGAVTLKVPASATDNPAVFLAAVDTLPVTTPRTAKIIIDARTGAVSAGGDMTLGPGLVSLPGITVSIGGDSTATTGTRPDGLVSLAKGATVQELAAGLRALSATPADVAAVFEALRSSGVVTAQVVVR